jgi:RNA polymerase sigma factor (sigma-70 family)
LSVAAPIAPSAVRAAETAALLYENNSQRILAFCLGRLRNREEAEDAVQQTFLKAFAAMRGGFRPTVERAWLYRIAENVCADRLRANGRRVRHEAGDGEAVLEVLPARDSQRIDGLEEALAALTPQQRHALLLREWQGLSYDEIASELRLSHSAVETLLFRARRSLARRLEALPLLPWLKSTLFGAGAGAKTAAAVAVTVGVGAATVGPIVVDRSSPAPRPAPVQATVAELPAAPRSAPARRTEGPSPTAAERSAPKPASSTQRETARPAVAVPETTEGSPATPAAHPGPTPRRAADTAPSAERNVPAPPPARLAPVEAPDTPALPLPALPDPNDLPVQLPVEVPLPAPKLELPVIEPPAPLQPVVDAVDRTVDLPLLP